MVSSYRLAVIVVVGAVLVSNVLASVDELIKVFGQAIDEVVPADRAAKYKAGAEKVRPCLEALVPKIGEQTLSHILNGMVPLAKKCGAELDSDGDVDTRKAKFLACCKKETEVAFNSLPESERQAFMEAKMCIKDMILNF